MTQLAKPAPHFENVRQSILAARAQRSAHSQAVLQRVSERQGRGSAGQLGRQVGQPADSILALAETDPAAREAVVYWTLEYNMPATDVMKKSMSNGLIYLAGGPQNYQAAPLGGLTVTTNQPQPSVIGCNTVMVSGVVKFLVPPKRKACNGVLVKNPDGLSTATDVPLLPAAVGPNTGDAQINAQAWVGGPLQELAILFSRAYALVIKVCGNVIFNEPVCKVARFDCGSDFFGASSSMEPTLRLQRDINEALIAAGYDSQFFLTPNAGAPGTEEEAPSPVAPVLLPTTFGAPTNGKCNGIFHFAKPQPFLADQPVEITFEAIPECRAELLALIDFVNKEGIEGFSASPLYNALVTGSTGTTGATTLGAEIWFGDLCISVELHGCQLSNKGWQLFWNTYTPDEKICSACISGQSLGRVVGGAGPTREKPGVIPAGFSAAQFHTSDEIGRIYRATGMLPAKEVMNFLGIDL